uniref:Helicase C-terminal domain-containing protein n=1 Tax=Panagrolaimus sp. PS1159 TaxID=55785 RepID=A0AC35EVB2_9BILA
MVFVNTKKTADKVADDLKYANFPATVIHSDFSQQRRDKTMAEFRKESSNCRILVSVNVVGRGIDVEEMDYVSFKK